jgi:hypothetical protein
MSHQSDEPLEVLRGIWSARGQTSADLQDSVGTPKSCKRMQDVGFGDPDSDEDLRTAWRSRLQREGKLSSEAGSIKDLILGSAEAAS